MVISQETYDKNRKKKIKIDQPFSYDHEKGQEDTEPYGFIPSSSNPGVWYLLTGKENNLRCSCPARVECRHLKDIQNGTGTCLRISGSIQKKI